jgi:hypothetical protein
MPHPHGVAISRARVRSHPAVRRADRLSARTSNGGVIYYVLIL